MKQALKQSFSILLRTALPTGLLLSLVVYSLRWLLFSDNALSLGEETKLFLLIVVAVCCTTYLVMFLLASIRMGIQNRW
jgi:hypothetical protein